MVDSRKPGTQFEGESALKLMWSLKPHAIWKVDTLDLAAITDPSLFPVIVHGTNKKAWPSIGTCSEAHH